MSRQPWARDRWWCGSCIEYLALTLILKQYYLGCLAHASYLLGDEASSTADHRGSPARHPAVPRRCGELGLKIRHVFLTHFHADFVAGHLELRDRCGATIHLGSRAEAEYAFVAMKDGDSARVPGTAPRSSRNPRPYDRVYLDPGLRSAEGSQKPYAVLTGDTLFIGDVGRPDLRASLGWTAKDLGAYLYDSLHNRLLPLPDETLVYPAHGAGSLCGKQLSSDTVSSLGDQRRLNYALQPMSKEQFISLVTADQPDAPPYFTYDAILNTRERATLDKNLEQVLQPVDLAEVLRMGDEGPDPGCSDPAEYAKGHLAGSINIGLGRAVRHLGGHLTRSHQANRDHRRAGTRSRRRHYDWAVSVSIMSKDTCRGEWKRLPAAPDLVWPTERISAPMVAEELESADPPLVLDIRNPREWAAKHIDGSVNIPLNHLQERIGEIPRDRPIAVHCAGGYRSSIAASILHQHGLTHLIEMAGGLAAWEAAQSAGGFAGLSAWTSLPLIGIDPSLTRSMSSNPASGVHWPTKSWKSAFCRVIPAR